jgi:16S rRNA (guanine527-N7)-methyltransferase
MNHAALRRYVERVRASGGPVNDFLVDLHSKVSYPFTCLVLAILGVAPVTLVDSDQRKAAFLREAGRVTGAAVSVVAGRIEALPAIWAGIPYLKIQYVISPYAHNRLQALPSAGQGMR